MTVLFVALGGALGAVMRYLCGLWLAFPYATAFVNMVGSFLIGAVYIWVSQNVSLGTAHSFLMTGLLGGFTTYATFSLDALRLIEQDQFAAAALYVMGTLTVCILAVFAGAGIVRSVLT